MRDGVRAEERLASWRVGATRDAVLDFLDAARDVPVDDRVAVFDNDGTLWCERPNYVQLEFLLDQLATAVAADPALAEREEYRALLQRDHDAQSELGLERIALALVDLCSGITPEEFDARVRRFFDEARHPERGVPYRAMRYRPMLELLDALRAADFDVFIVSGGGTEFVRAIGRDFYGVAPQAVVGTMVTYRFERDAGGAPQLVRTTGVVGTANEGEEKVANIQRALGRRPILAAGNSAGDREMLEYALGGDGPGLALLVDHDDAEREYAYESEGATVGFDGDLVGYGRASGWTVVSMRDDWEAVFADR